MFDKATRATVKEKLISAESHDDVVDVSFDMTLKLYGKGDTTVVHEVGVDTWKQVGGNWVMIKTVDKTFDTTTQAPKKKKKG